MIKKSYQMLEANCLTIAHFDQKNSKFIKKNLHSDTSTCGLTNEQCITSVVSF